MALWSNNDAVPGLATARYTVAYLAVASPGTASLLLHKAILIFPVNFFV